MVADLKTVTTKIAKLEQRVDMVEQPIRFMHKRMDELESYTRRWNLKLMRVPKSAQENVRPEVLKICQVLLPSMKYKFVDAIDTVHRLGKKRQSTDDTRPRGIILQFVSRVCRDSVWRAAKNSSYLREHGLLFKKDFSKGDREEAEAVA